MENLRIYKEALLLTSKVYKLTGTRSVLVRDRALSDQVRRASVSIAANIAEGYKRTNKQYKNYLQIASGSANEVVALLQIIGLVYKIDTKDLQEEFKVLGRQINAFSNKLKGSR